MVVPKKHIAISKKRIRKTIWKRKGYWTSLKAFSLGKSLSTGNSKKRNLYKKINKKILE